STKIRDIYGDIKTINNAQITTVINKTKELSMADVVVGINYGESIEKVEAVFRKEIKHIKSKIAEAEEEVAYLGVQDLSASSVDLLFITYCKEENVASVKRKMRRELKIIFDKYNIEIPYQHITLENKEGGFESAVVIEEDINDIQEEPVDFENLLFNKSIPDKNNSNEEQEVTSNQVKNNEPLFDDTFLTNKAHYIQPVSNSDDEYIVGQIQVVNIGNNPSTIKQEKNPIQKTIIVEPQLMENFEYLNDDNFDDVFIAADDNHQAILISKDDNILDEIIDDLMHDDNEKLEKIVLPKEEKNNEVTQVKKQAPKKKTNTTSNKKKKVITENVKEDINPEITNLEQALGSFIEEEKK
ncbi:MAG: mechanosensitive ion channel family protein, partial [Peptostreptococcaceae bacterium]